MPKPESADYMVCDDGCDPIPVDEFESVGPLYECECGERFTRETSANGNHQCPACNKFAAREADEACPSCNAAPTERQTLYRCPKCAALHPVEQDAVKCCGPKRMREKKRRDERAAENARLWREKEARRIAEAPEIGDLSELLTMIPLPKTVRYAGTAYECYGGTLRSADDLFGEKRLTCTVRYVWFGRDEKERPSGSSELTVYAGRCKDGVVRMVYVCSGNGLFDHEAEAAALKAADEWETA